MGREESAEERLLRIGTEAHLAEVLLDNALLQRFFREQRDELLQVLDRHTVEPELLEQVRATWAATNRLQRKLDEYVMSKRVNG